MKLYPHQIEALNLVKDKNRCAIYYDMGLGKTYIGSEKMKELGAMINLVICQKSKVDDWVNHFKQNYNTGVVYDLTIPMELDEFLNVNEKGPAAYRGYRIKSAITRFVGVINYDLAWRRPELLKLRDFTLMLDESSLITNRTAKRSSFILKMIPSNVILLSGTPTAGKYEKLWSQLQLLGWNITEDTYFKSYVDYEWVETDDGYWEKKIKGYKNVEHLKKRLGKFGAIFKKTNEVMDLPEQVNQMIYIEPTKEYKQFVKNHYLQIDDKELIGDNTLTKILYERQLCGQYNQDKLGAFRDLVESTEDRLVVFYNFTAELDRLRMIANDLNRPHGAVNGQNKNLEPYERYDNSITFVQYQAGAYGLNLQKANKVIYFSLPLGLGSCDLWEQSKKRIHRMGQDRTCFYYYLLVKDSIEVWNFDLLKKGKELTDELFVKRKSDND